MKNNPTMPAKPILLLVFGTRPEAIKMAPVYVELCKLTQFTTQVCVTGQHRHMLDQALEFFNITPDYDLALMQPGQTLGALAARVLDGMQELLATLLPACVLVHGDTTTSTMAALAAFYTGIPVAHVEAGLRTYNTQAPFPEELNRQLTGRLTTWHFAPTRRAAQNLLSEGVHDSAILITGNTVIDALHQTVARLANDIPEEIQAHQFIQALEKGQRLVLVTGHRRENFGAGMEEMCNALAQIATEPETHVIYPVHLNPNVREPVLRLLGSSPSVHLIEPLSYPAFVWLMNRSYLVVTDSGGVQEEAPGLGKPVLVMRTTTERPEALEAGTVLLTGTSPDRLVVEAHRLLRDPEHYQRMSQAQNPYGDGNAAPRIAAFLVEKLAPA
jgi:UDP-N-acetylglucosamine 2-epimerase (non-hydrolysing)